MFTGGESHCLKCDHLPVHHPVSMHPAILRLLTVAIIPICRARMVRTAARKTMRRLPAGPLPRRSAPVCSGMTTTPHCSPAVSAAGRRCPQHSALAIITVLASFHHADCADGMWMSGHIAPDRRGIGSGISVILFAGIVSAIDRSKAATRFVDVPDRLLSGIVPRHCNDYRRSCDPFVFIVYAVEC